MAQQIYGSIAIKGASKHSDLRAHSLSFSRKIVGMIDGDEMLDIEEEPLFNYGCENLGRICLEYQDNEISKVEALEGIEQEIHNLFAKETSFDGDTAHTVIEVSCWDDGSANNELFNAFCRHLTHFSDQDYYFENVIGLDRLTGTNASILHKWDKSNKSWVSKNSEEVLEFLIATSSSDLARALSIG